MEKYNKQRFRKLAGLIDENLQSDKKKILSLKNGEKYIVPESDYGIAEILFKNNKYFLYSIPMFGGGPVFEDEFDKNEVDLMIQKYNSWT